MVMRLLRKSGDVPKRSLWQRIKDVALMDVGVLARGGVSAGSLESLEQLLLEADFGVPVTLRLVEEVERRAQRGLVKTQEEFHEALAEGIDAALRGGKSDPALLAAPAVPTVILVVGVNGAGKTTFIGKLSERFRGEQKRVMVAAGDTFRAGAIDQLRVWAERTGAEFIAAQPGADPAAVAFDAIDAAIARQADVLIVDTAGRLHTSEGLMTELRKVARVIAKRLPGAPHETLLVLDGTIGQNAVQQARTFAEAVPVTGLVVTKLDGTARGGVVVAVHEAINVPVKFLSVGESATDLVPFEPAAFARELLEA
jgi:fused signal recognition particle receptor